MYFVLWVTWEMEILNSAVPTQKFMILEKASSRKFLKIRFSIFF